MNKLNLTNETTFLTKEQAIKACNIFLKEYHNMELTDTSIFNRDEYYYDRTQRFPGVNETLQGSDGYCNTIVKYLVPLLFADNKFRRNSEFSLLQAICIGNIEYADTSYDKLITWGYINGIHVLWSIIAKSSLVNYDFNDRVRLKTRFYDFGFSIEFVLEHIDELKEDTWSKIKDINLVNKEDIFTIIDKVFKDKSFFDGDDLAQDELLNKIYFECYCECYRKTQGSPQLLFDEMENRGLLNKDKWIQETLLKLK